MRSRTEEESIREYVDGQGGGAVIHLERAASELVGPVRHDIWDVYCAESRWWVVTNPTNLYSQADFKSRDVVLTFHIGLALRMEYGRERDVPVAPEPAALLPGSWRRWQQAFEAYDSGDEAENFQAVGVRLRECLLSFIRGDAKRRSRCRRRAAAEGLELQGLDRAAGESSRGGRERIGVALLPEEGGGRDVGLRELAHACQERRAARRRDRSEGGRASVRCVHRGPPPLRPSVASLRGLRVVTGRRRHV
jgi:hypothetical protein